MDEIAMFERIGKLVEALEKIAALPTVNGGMDSTEAYRSQQEMRLNEQARAIALAALAATRNA